LRVFLTSAFARFARKERIDDQRLRAAVARAERGSVDADLGGGVIKQRVARPGGGRSGGYRTLIAYRAAHRSVFLHGFAKSDPDNVDDRELGNLKKLARYYFSFTDEQISLALQQMELKEVACNDEDKV
jgi:hypothetical protein